MIGRALFLVFFLLFGDVVGAQTSIEPAVTLDLTVSETIPGQSVELRITVLVPTWMPKPVIFPSFEAPNLMVRLPERATNPTSERIGRETWSGVTRRYIITPMAPGSFSIPAQELIVTWSDPETNAPREDRIKVEQITITGVLPEGAEDLDPFIAANSVTLTQTIEGPEPPLSPGDSVTREITAVIEGTSPVFLPSLLKALPVQGIAMYPAEPVVTETSKHGAVGGSRVERITYLAQSGGDGTASPVSVTWYNLDTGRVETASVEPVALTVDAPVLRDMPTISIQTVIWAVGILGAVLILSAYAVRPLRDRWAAIRAGREARYLASPEFACDRVRSAIRQRDLAACLQALELLASRLENSDPLQDHAIADAITSIGAARYSRDMEGSVEAECWARLDAAFRTYRPALWRRTGVVDLPPLNPRSMPIRSS